MFIEFYNGVGWSSDGFSTMVGILAIVNSFLGLDCSAHMGKWNQISTLSIHPLTTISIAEEIKDSSRTLPVSLMKGLAVNSLLGFLVVITV